MMRFSGIARKVLYKSGFFLFFFRVYPQVLRSSYNRIIDMLLIYRYITHFWICHSFLDMYYLPGLDGMVEGGGVGGRGLMVMEEEVASVV